MPSDSFPISDKAPVNKIFEALKKTHGDQVLVSFTGKDVYPKLDVISTGSPLLDHALGTGGIPRGRITMVWGHEGGGKSSILYQVYVQAQRKYPDQYVAEIDGEYAFDINRAHQFGMSDENFVLHQPESAEQAWDVVEGLIRTNSCSVIGIDSIAALVPDVEEEEGIEKQQVGLQSRLNTKALRKITPIIARSNTALVVINQARANLRAANPYSPVEIVPGGFGLQHACSVIIHMNRIGWHKGPGDEIIGIDVKAEISKNKGAPPKRDAQFTIYFDRGVHEEEDIFSIAVELGIVKKSGSWYKYEEENIGQGDIKAAKWLLDHTDVTQKVVDALYSN